MVDESRHTNEFADKRSPWTKPGFVAAAALMVVVVLAGVAIAVWPDPGRPGASPTAGPTEEPSSAQSGSAAGPTEIPTAAPNDVTWQLVKGTPLPFSKSAGPSRVGTTASGYARTPTGALIAVVQLATRGGPDVDRSIWEPTIKKQWVASPDRDRWYANVSAEPQTRPGDVALVGAFRFVAYSVDAAVLDVMYRYGATAIVATLTVRWLDDDWRMVAPPGGTLDSVVRKATDLSGFIEWGPK